MDVDSCVNCNASKHTPVLLEAAGELELYVANYNDVAVVQRDRVFLNFDIVYGEGVGVGAAADVPLGAENVDADDGMFRTDLQKREYAIFST